MKIFNTLFLVLFTISSFAQSFEGAINFDILNGSTSEKGTMLWTTKNGKHRIDYKTVLEGQEMEYTVFLFENSNEIVVVTNNNGQPFVSKVDLSTVQNNFKGLEEARLEKSNEKTTYVGYNASKLIFKSPYFKAICWISDDSELKNLKMPKALAKTGMNVLFEKNNISSFPLEVLAKDEEGNILFLQSVISVEKKTIQDNVFNYNSYQVLEPKVTEIKAE
jgi:hypothetical protein